MSGGAHVHILQKNREWGVNEYSMMLVIDKNKANLYHFLFYREERCL